MFCDCGMKLVVVSIRKIENKVWSYFRCPGCFRNYRKSVRLLEDFVGEK